MKTLLAFLAVIFFTLTSPAQSFQKIYSSTGMDSAYSVVVLNDGYLIAGSTNSFAAGGQDAYVIRTDLSGNPLWSKTYGGLADDKVYSMQKTNEGNFILAGTTKSFIGPSLQDISNIYLFKIDSNGTLLWSRSIGLNVWDIAYSVHQTFDNGYILTGYTGNLFPGPGTMNLLKTDSMGNIQWAQVYSSAPTTGLTGRGVTQTSDSGYAVTGYIKGIPSFADTNLLLIKTNSTGTIVTSLIYTYTGSAIPNQSYGYDIIENASGDLVIAGASGGLVSGAIYIYAPLLLQTDYTGTVINAKTFSLNSGDCRAYSIVQTPDHGYLLGGQMGNFYPMMLKTDSTVTTQWCHYYGTFGSITGEGYSAKFLPGGGAIIAGFIDRSSGTAIHLIKVNGYGLSGCNEGNPSLQGVSGNSIQTSATTALFASSTYVEFAAATITNTPLTADSVLCIAAGINDFNPSSQNQNSMFSIFPDPVKAVVTILFLIDQHEIMNLELLNLYGQKLKTLVNDRQSEPNTPLTFSLKGFPAGIYFLKLNIHGREEIKRVVKL